MGSESHASVPTSVEIGAPPVDPIHRILHHPGVEFLRGLNVICRAGAYVRVGVSNPAPTGKRISERGQKER